MNKDVLYPWTALVGLLVLCLTLAVWTEAQKRVPSTLDRHTTEIIARAKALEEAAFKVATGRGSGSGWRYDRRWVITNAHVVGTATTVTLSQGTDMEWVAPVRYVDRVRDLAAIEVLPSVPGRSLSLSADPPVSGSWIMASGAPLGDYGHTTWGHVSKYDLDAVSMCIQIAPGSSGSAIINHHGEVVGVVRAGVVGPFGVAWTVAVSTHALHEFMAALEERYEDPDL